MKAAIFDLDGVIVDTAVHHYAAWREMALRLGFDLTLEDNERLKGVGRMHALRIVLSIGGIDLPEDQLSVLAEQKNARYVELIDALVPADVLPGARELLQALRERGVPVALGSASRNARRILDRLDLVGLFDVIVDGTVVSEAKPDPQVFLVAARRLGVLAADCAVFEDAVAGIEAARAGGMVAIGVGDPAVLVGADRVIAGLHEADPTEFCSGERTSSRPHRQENLMLGLDRAPFHLDAEARAWVSATRDALTLEQKVGQLFCLLAVPATPEEIDRHFAIAEPGGYMRRPAPRSEILELNRYLQSRARVPLLIAANLEAGADGLATDATSFGNPLQVAATDDEKNAYLMGQVSGREARALGCRWAFSPIVDIQMNFANPITLTRAFGSDPRRVARMGAEFVRGVQEAAVAASVKHWPGDGVDDRDQHLVTSINDLSVDAWEATFGEVYRAVIAAGAMTVMAAHIALPEYSRALRPGIADEDILPASLAPEITTELLRDRLGFRGLVVSDASTMAGMQLPMPRRDMVPKTIAAGCDMFLFSTDYEEDYAFMLAGVRTGVITPERLDEAVTRVLALKAALDLHAAASPAELVRDGAYERLDLDAHREHARASADAAVTLVKSREAGLLPLDPARHPRVLVYSLRGRDATTEPAEQFCSALRDEGFTVRLYQEDQAPDTGSLVLGRDGAVVGKELLADFDLVVYLADVSPTSNVPTARLTWSYKTGANVPKYVTEIPTIVISLGSPFHLQDVPRVRTFINAYAHNRATVQAVVDKLLGRSAFAGVSPVDPFCGYWDARL